MAEQKLKTWLYQLSLSLLAQEFSPQARQAILDNTKWVNEWVGSLRPAPHVFSDVKGMVPEGSFNPDDDFATQAQSIDRAMMSTSQHCVTHGGHCTLLKPVDFDVSGLPCEENSRANCKRKYLQGRFGSLYLVWSKYHRTMRTPLVILENTPESCQCWYWVQLFYAMLDFHLCYQNSLLGNYWANENII